MKPAFTALLLLLVVARAVADDTPLGRLAGFLTGSFSSADQAYVDKSYRNATLRCVRIWTHRTDGPWFYAEQALFNAPEQPYRQVVYQLVPAPDGAIELHPFSLPNPIAQTGAWRDPLSFNKLAPADLSAREGCTVTLRPEPDGSFKGSTAGRGCFSDLNGATYATAEMIFTKDTFTSWDRGYNAAGRQVWGPLNGGYLFKRIE